MIGFFVREALDPFQRLHLSSCNHKLFLRVFSGFALRLALRLGIAAAAVAAGCWAIVFAPPTTHAQESEWLTLMQEPTTYLNVLDGVRGVGWPQVHASAEVRRSLRSGKIQREETSGLGFTDVATHFHRSTLLDFTLQVGIIEDLMVFAVLPVVLDDSRGLHVIGDENQQGSLQTSAGATIANLPYQSLTRSGVDTVNLGLAWGVSNQYMEQNWPTIVLRAEAQLGIGGVLKPCRQDTSCNDRAVGKGMHHLLIEARMGRRLSFTELYTGFAGRYSWVDRASVSFQSGTQSLSPPQQLSWTAGLAAIPWENRAKWQRLTIDLRSGWSYLSSGRDYSPLFDVLGTSGVLANDIDTSLRGPSLTGAHARFHLRLAIEMLAARYVRFQIGAAVHALTAHLITGGFPCVENTIVDSETGACPPSVGDNAFFQPEVDSAGSRFAVTDDLTWDLFASATARF